MSIINIKVKLHQHEPNKTKKGQWVFTNYGWTWISSVFEVLKYQPS